MTFCENLFMEGAGLMSSLRGLRGSGRTEKFAVIGCQHPHISIFIEEMLELGYACAGIFEPGDLALAAQLAERYQLELAGSSKELLEEEQVQMIGSSAVNNQKLQIALDCEKYGKHLMLDKPAVVNSNGYSELEELINRGNIQIGMLLTERYRPALYTLREFVLDGELGELISITMRKPHRLRPETRPAWHFNKQESGGIIVDLLVHDFDLLRWLTGQEIQSVQATMGKRILPQYPDFYDTAAVQTVLDGGVSAQLYADWHAPEKCWTWGDGRIFVTGTLGSAEIRLAGDPAAKLDGEGELLLVMTHEEPLRQVPLRTPSVRIVEDFLNRIKGKPHEFTHQDLLAATGATLLADEQAERVLVYSGKEHIRKG
ncbi:Gfo/Idh/MocA family oxidoreductase [Paenibacillus sp. 453mf]|uniref:Gfo/Idh/MocA family protein n=1 Tax=Paenibacillus sp. 453mf TaxID=1761874 RepID=UPI0008ED8ED1|nr:Gfo/Idh/MocA family oxidoreductase [Paenibacillus sp. 453mf]SFS96588.1 Predicted dehydrogenase [Paenibacillus sp. 453mf]